MTTVLITSATFTTHPTGISQTLENILDYLEDSELVLCTPTEAKGTFSKYSTIETELPWWMKKLPEWALDGYLNRFHYPTVVKKMKKARPQCVIIANLDHPQVKIARMLLEDGGIPFYVYLLDNIDHNPDQDSLWLMNNATGHIFISRYMAEANMQKFETVTNYLIAHNPVAAEEISEKCHVNGTRSVAYAGALWPMHYDAFILVADAIKKMRHAGQSIEFVVYTSPYFHQLKLEDFIKYDITYGGFYPFNELKPKLKVHGGLLVTSSFLKEFKNLSAYSVQTKITDYLAAGVPTISIGPDYGACNRFINENGIGFVISSNEKEHVIESLSAILDSSEEVKSTICNAGLELVKTKHNKEFIQENWKAFIKW